MLEQRTRSVIKSWGFLFTEMVLIVASILFAFTLDSWWDERKEQVEETKILHGLQEEFLHNRAVLEDRIDKHSRNLAAMVELLDATMSGSPESTELEIDHALASLVAPPTTDLGSGVLNALISAGRLELLTNRELGIRLAEWEGVFGEVLDDEIMGRKFVFEEVVPYLIRHGVPMSGPFSTWPEGYPSGTRSISDDPDALARLLSDPQVRTMLEVRIGFKIHATGEYREALEAVDGILSEIDTSLSDRRLYSN
jgi:hypothetical protein